MNPWKILGIEETTDRKIIKRAYTGLIKRHHPEDDAEGFKRIREAYEAALEQAAYLSYVEIAENQSDESVEKVYPEEIRQATDLRIKVDGDDEYFSISDLPSDKSGSPAGEVTKRIERVRQLLVREPDRSDTDEWEKIFNDESLINIETRMQFSFSLFAFFAENQRDEKSEIRLPEKVWRCIDLHMNWRSNEIRFHHMFHEDEVDAVLDPVRAAFNEVTSDNYSGNSSENTSFTDTTVQKPGIPVNIIIIASVFLLRFFCKMTEDYREEHNNYNRPVKRYNTMIQQKYGTPFQQPHLEYPDEIIKQIKLNTIFSPNPFIKDSLMDSSRSETDDFEKLLEEIKQQQPFHKIFTGSP